MQLGNKLAIVCILLLHSVILGNGSLRSFDLLETWRQLNEIVTPKPEQEHHQALSKVVFPIPDHIIKERSYLPDLGFLTDLAFLFLPRNFPASGIVRLSRDLLESEQCVQYVGCEMVHVAQRHQSLSWMRNFIDDFPFQGDFVERLKQGSTEALMRLNERKKMSMGDNDNHKQADRTTVSKNQCAFSCHPLKSLSRGLKILSLLHDLVRTVKY